MPAHAITHGADGLRDGAVEFSPADLGAPDARNLATVLRSDWARFADLLAGHGAIRLRGFALERTADFAQAVSLLPTFQGGYVGGASPRKRIEGAVMEATSADPGRRLRMHQEMAYLPRSPRYLAFFCLLPAPEGGETLIGDMRAFTARVPREVKAELRERGLRYVRNFRNPEVQFVDPVFPGYHKDWYEAFGTGSRREVERLCRSLGVQFEWEEDASLTIHHSAAAFRAHPRSGDEIWFNTITSQLPREHLYGGHYAAFAETYATRTKPYDVRFGDGGRIDDALADRLEALLDSLVQAPAWRAGDVLLIDNYTASHGRNPYRGARDVQVVLLDA